MLGCLAGLWFIVGKNARLCSWIVVILYRRQVSGLHMTCRQSCMAAVGCRRVHTLQALSSVSVLAPEFEAVVLTAGADEMFCLNKSEPRCMLELQVVSLVDIGYGWGQCTKGF